MVERASAWTDEQRNRMLGLLEYESHCCATCGTHEDLDPETHVYVPDAKRCRICAGLTLHQRVVGVDDDEEAKALKDQPSKPRDRDGRKLILRPATPAELEQREEQRKRPPGGQTSGSSKGAPGERRRGPRRGLARG